MTDAQADQKATTMLRYFRCRSFDVVVGLFHVEAMANAFARLGLEAISSELPGRLSVREAPMEASCTTLEADVEAARRAHSLDCRLRALGFDHAELGRVAGASVEEWRHLAARRFDRLPAARAHTILEALERIDRRARKDAKSRR